MSDVEPGAFNLPQADEVLTRAIQNILDLPPDAYDDEAVMLPLCKDLAEVIESQRTLIEQLDEFFNETLTTTEALEALTEAGIPLADPKSVEGALEKQRAQLSDLEALDALMVNYLSPEGQWAVSAYMIAVRRTRLTVDAITDRYDHLMLEDEGT